MDIAETGDASEVDMLVRDIYGGSYDGMNLQVKRRALLSLGPLPRRAPSLRDTASRGRALPLSVCCETLCFAR